MPYRASSVKVGPGKLHILRRCVHLIGYRPAFLPSLLLLMFWWFDICSSKLIRSGIGIFVPILPFFTDPFVF